MSSAAPNKEQVLRAAAILTTGEVAGSSFVLNNAFASRASLLVNFTLGSLTNGIVRLYVSKDGVTYYPLESGTVSRTYTGDTDAVIPIDGSGWRFFRASIQGTGTVTSSEATLTLRYLQAGSQA